MATNISFAILLQNVKELNNIAADSKDSIINHSHTKQETTAFDYRVTCIS